MGDELAAALGAVVGTEHVLTDRDVLTSFETDWTRRWAGRARLAVRPASTGEVAACVRACAAAGAAIVVQGGNTGLVGGGVPRGGEVVLSTSRLDEVAVPDAAAAQVAV